MHPAVVITGMGIVSAIGHNVEEYAASLRAGRSGVRRQVALSERLHLPVVGATIEGFSYDAALAGLRAAIRDQALPGRAVTAGRRAPFPVQVSLLAGLEAWHDAGLVERPVAAERVALVICGSNLTHAYQDDQRESFERDPAYLNPRFPLHMLDTDQVGTLSEVLAIRGEGFTVGAASASGTVGIVKAWQLLRAGVADVCVVVGVTSEWTPMEVQGFLNIGALGGQSYAEQPERASRPFDTGHEGFIFGQAGGCLVLETLASARQREAHIRGELLGGAVVLDANRQADPSAAGEARAMRQALHAAGVAPHQVDYVNAHATSSPLGDRTEIEALREVFGESLGRVWINATKSLTGHCMHAAGVVEAIAVILQMEHGFLHSMPDLEHPIAPDGRFTGPRCVEAQVSMALSNSFGFGGLNSCAVFRKA